MILSFNLSLSVILHIKIRLKEINILRSIFPKKKIKKI